MTVSYFPIFYSKWDDVFSESKSLKRDKPLTESGTRTIIKEVFKEFGIGQETRIICEYCNQHNPITEFRCSWCNASLGRPKENIKQLEYSYSENTSKPSPQYKIYDEEEYKKDKVEPSIVWRIPEVYSAGT